VPEAPVEETEHGKVVTGDGWFVLNAREARWGTDPTFGPICTFEGEVKFPELGINVSVLEPGHPMCMYHWENAQENFLVLDGEGVLIVEGEERPLRKWDFVHCPPRVPHVIVAAGSTPCVVLAVGARHATDEGAYPRDETALRFGAGVEEETSDPGVAYARFPKARPARYPEGALPD
jgi:uncharacterized cupin superfamily protein